MADNRGTYHLTDNPDIYEPARSNTFEFVVTDLTGLLKAGLNSGVEPNEDDYIKNGQEILRCAVESSSVPHFELGVIDVKRGNNTAHFAGLPKFSTHSITVKDYVSINSGYSNPKDIMLAWQALAYNVRTEKIARASAYKKTCTLTEYSADFNQVVREWTLEGCWCSAVSEDQFSSETEGQRKFTATIVFDKAYPSSERPVENQD